MDDETNNDDEKPSNFITISVYIRPNLSIKMPIRLTKTPWIVQINSRFRLNTLVLNRQIRYIGIVSVIFFNN